MIYHDRVEAGEKLAARLARLNLRRPLVLGVSQGAMPLAEIVAQKLGGDLDILLMHKISPSWKPELVIGATDENGNISIAPAAVKLGLSEYELMTEARALVRSLRARREIYTPFRAGFRAEGREVVVIADGAATGASLCAAANVLKTQLPRRLIVATPVASVDAAALLDSKDDIHTCFLRVPEDFHSVRDAYAEFEEVSDEEVAILLARCERQVVILGEGVALKATLCVPRGASGLVLVLQSGAKEEGSGFERLPAKSCNAAGLASLTFSLLRESEAREREKLFDLRLQAERLRVVLSWVKTQPALEDLAIGCLGTGVAAGAAFVVAAERAAEIKAVVAMAGRADLAGEALSRVASPSLLIVGGNDDLVTELNESALAQIRAEKSLAVIPGASHLFEETGALEVASGLASSWFVKNLASASRRRENRLEVSQMA